jgi:putative ABC transport system permease protein
VIRYLELASLRWLGSHRWQLAAAVLGVALGLSCVVGVELAARSAIAAFERSTRALAGRATHGIFAGPDGLDARDYARLVRDFPRCEFAPILERDVRVQAGPGKLVTLVGVDPAAEARLRGATLATLSLDDSALAARSVWLASTTARELGLESGTELELLVDGRPVAARLAGTLASDDPAAASALAGRAFADLAAAEELTGSRGRLTRIDVRAADDAELARLERALPAGAELAAVDARVGELERMSRAMRFDLRAFALLALFVGAFLVYDTATFSVVQRRELFGRMRALGASRATLFATVAHEALWIGLAGSALGLALGLAVARVLVEPLARTFTDLYAPVEAVALDVDAPFLAAAAGLGVAATLVGSLLPAWEVAAAAPRNALARSNLETRARRGVAPLAWLALALLAGAWTLLETTTELAPALVASFAVFLAAGAAAPFATVCAARLAARLAVRCGGALERIAARSVEAALSRTAVAVATLGVALSASLGMGSMIASLRSTLDGWMQRNLAADVYVWAPHRGASRSDGVLAPELVDRIRALPEIEEVATTRGVMLGRDADGVFVVALESTARGRAGYRLLAGEAEPAWRAFDAGDVLVSEALARRRGLGVGSTLALAGAPAPSRVAGIFQDFSTDRGYALVARTTYDRWFADRARSGLGLHLAAGADPEAVAARIRNELAPGGALGVHSNASLRAATFGVFDRTFSVARALELFAALIAALACVSSLAALEFERARELALLRAEGLDPRGVVRLVLGRSLLVGATAAALAIPLGLTLAALLVFELQPRAFGWTLAWTLDRSAFARVAALALGAALVAGLFPAWTALRTSPARALTEE